MNYRSAPPVVLTPKVRELLRLFASDPVMAGAMYMAYEDGCTPAGAMFRVSAMSDDEWQSLEDKFRG